MIRRPCAGSCTDGGLTTATAPPSPVARCGPDRSPAGGTTLRATSLRRSPPRPHRPERRTMTPGVNSAWLAVREPEDARARSTALAEALASQVHGTPVIAHDLGSGTGSMMRWLAPMLPGPQNWTLHDRDVRFLPRRRRRPTPRRPQRIRRLGVHARRCARRSGRRGPAGVHPSITASALLDVLTEDELRAVASRCVAVGAPVLFALTVTGDVAATPADPLDDDLRAAFNAHQQRAHACAAPARPDSRRPGARSVRQRRVGRSAPSTHRGASAGIAPRLRQSGWPDGRMRPLSRGPSCDRRPPAYRARRTAQARAGALSIDVHHRDLMAWPP